MSGDRAKGTDLALPIDAVLPDLMEALRRDGRAVLEAPPGAGKTTRVPLALLAAGFIAGRIVMLEPRRLATRGAAQRMADSLGEDVGARVGYRMRGEARVSAATRIEVVTEAILTRMIQSDPALDGIGCVIFDEFHERALSGDLGLALAWQVRQVLRPDLVLLVMSATLDAAPIAAFLDDAPRITAEGRAYPVEPVWLPRPLDRSLRFEGAMAGLIRQAARENEGGILAFLPGEGEIRRVLGQLDMPEAVALYGAMPFAAQQAVLAKGPNRKIILATSIAETSLTIDGITTVVDGGLARRSVFDPASGMARLVTEQVSRAEATQRQGRAGRQVAGRAYKLWSRAEEGALPSHPPPEIVSGDLVGLALDLALWGDGELRFLTEPDPARLAEARALLGELGALVDGRITAMGRRMAALPLHPRLAHMLLVAGQSAAPLAALLSDRDPQRGSGVDLQSRLDALRQPGSDPALRRIADEAARIARLVDPSTDVRTPGAMAALAFPDRIAQRRGDSARFLLSGGKGARLDVPAFAQDRYLVVTESDGDPREAVIRTALPLSEGDLRDLGPVRGEDCHWSPRDQRIIARQVERIGALVVAERPLAAPPQGALLHAQIEGLRALGLTFGAAAQSLRDRVQFLRKSWPELPDLSESALAETLGDWLGLFLGGQRTAAELRALDLLPALRHLVEPFRAEIDHLAPAQFTTPLGRHIAIDYAGEHPEITLRLQEMFGVTRHPVVGKNRLPLRVTLLSPGGKPIQTTQDIPGFWRSSYLDVRKDMRGRYPRHPWPEDPWNADPTLRAKPREK